MGGALSSSDSEQELKAKKTEVKKKAVTKKKFTDRQVISDSDDESDFVGVKCKKNTKKSELKAIDPKKFFGSIKNKSSEKAITLKKEKKRKNPDESEELHDDPE